MAGGGVSGDDVGIVADVFAGDHGQPPIVVVQGGHVTAFGGDVQRCATGS